MYRLLLTNDNSKENNLKDWNGSQCYNTKVNVELK